MWGCFPAKKRAFELLFHDEISPNPNAWEVQADTTTTHQGSQVEPRKVRITCPADCQYATKSHCGWFGLVPFAGESQRLAEAGATPLAQDSLDHRAVHIGQSESPPLIPIC